MFLPDARYDACDELGIMVYHDMQYAQKGHSPRNNPVQDAELRHQIRRLSHHPAIVLVSADTFSTCVSRSSCFAVAPH